MKLVTIGFLALVCMTSLATSQLEAGVFGGCRARRSRPVRTRCVCPDCCPKPERNLQEYPSSGPGITQEKNGTNYRIVISTEEGPRLLIFDIVDGVFTNGTVVEVPEAP